MPIGFDPGGSGASASGGNASGTSSVESPLVDLVEIRIEQWRTASDERVCPECGPLAWYVWQEGSGPYPPLHINCRCVRVYVWSEYQVREV